jgi:hypothetical protein
MNKLTQGHQQLAALKNKTRNGITREYELDYSRNYTVQNKTELLEKVPLNILISSVFIAWNSLGQGIAEIVYQPLMMMHVLPEAHLDASFYFLAALSALLAHHILSGIRRQEIDVTQDSVQIGLLVECALLISDVIFVQTHFTQTILLMRLPFMVLTAINIFLLIRIIYILKLFEFNLLRRVSEWIGE